MRNDRVAFHVAGHSRRAIGRYRNVAAGMRFVRGMHRIGRLQLVLGMKDPTNEELAHADLYPAGAPDRWSRRRRVE